MNKKDQLIAELEAQIALLKQQLREALEKIASLQRRAKRRQIFDMDYLPYDDERKWEG